MVRQGSPDERPEGSLEVAPQDFLIDTSAWARSTQPSIHDRIGGLVVAGRAATCGVVELELLFSSRGLSDLVTARADRLRNMRLVPMDQADFERAAGLMEELARRAMHRAVGIADLLIAACAERSGLTLLHYDSDYDRVAGITEQRTEWVAPRGSLP